MWGVGLGGTAQSGPSRLSRLYVQTCPELIEQSLMVSHELIRVAILWHEQWHEGLEEASRMCASHHISCDSAFQMMAPSFAAAFVRSVRTVASDY